VLLERRTGWPKHKIRKGVQGDVFVVVIVVIRFMSLLGACTMTMTSGVTRSNWRNGAATTTLTLCTCGYLPLPLSEGNVVIVGPLLKHLLAGTTDLRRCGKVA
jgi:hypothetical protein